MGGNSVDDDWELASSSNEVRTLVLVGRTGNGKSATGNSILGRKAFKSKAGSLSVTSSCDMQTTMLSDGQIVNVIDTPGLFDHSTAFEFLGEEIVKCIDLAKDGIHAILAVYSVKTRFTYEEVTALHSLQTLFGSKIVDYMIVVFTGGDDLEDNDETLEDYLCSECPEPLKEVLTLCENRCVLFDNRTKDKEKQSEQVQQLLSLVNMVISKNDGRPYTNDYFTELKKGAMELQNHQREADSSKGYSKIEILEMKMQMQLAHEEMLKRMVEMVVADLRKATRRLEKQLAEEKAARLMSEKKSDDEIKKLREHLEKAHQKESEERKKLMKDLEMAQEKLGKRGDNGCVIL